MCFFDVVFHSQVVDWGMGSYFNDSNMKCLSNNAFLVRGVGRRDAPLAQRHRKALWNCPCSKLITAAIWFPRSAVGSYAYSAPEILAKKLSPGSTGSSFHTNTVQGVPGTAGLEAPRLILLHAICISAAHGRDGLGFCAKRYDWRCLEYVGGCWFSVPFYGITWSININNGSTSFGNEWTSHDFTLSLVARLQEPSKINEMSNVSFERFEHEISHEHLVHHFAREMFNR